MKATSTINSLFSREDSKIVVYYVFLSIITVLLTRPDAGVGEFTRVLYSAAIFIPPLIKSKWLPFSVTVFLCVSMCSFSPLLPSKTFLIVIAALFVSIFHKKLSVYGIKAYIWLLLFYILIIDLFFFDFQEWIVYSLLLLVCFNGCIKDESDVKILALSFVFISVILSALFLLNFETFLVQYSKEDDISRSGWINPNVFGGHLVIGVIAAFWLLRNLKDNKISFLLLVASMVLTLLTLIMNASRGAIIAVVLPLVIMTLFSKMKRGYKIATLFAGLLFVVFSFTNGYYDLLMFRLSDDTLKTGGLRTTIWLQKFNEFNQEGVFDFVFGVGQSGCKSLAQNGRTHNDFLTALFAYGIIGLALFVVTLFKPLFLRKNYRRVEIVAFYSVLFIECFALEPFFRGYFIYYVFFLFILKYLRFCTLK